MAANNVIGAPASRLKIAVLDDYANMSLSSANWSLLDDVAEISVFNTPIGEAEAVATLLPFDILCTLRERMAMSASLFDALPNLKLVTVVGRSLANLDADAATRCGVVLVHPSVDLRHPDRDRFVHATPELAWGLVIATARNIVRENERMRCGMWRGEAGMLLAGRTLGLLGLGATGQIMAGYGRAFGMRVIAWSENLTEDAASRCGAAYVEKDELFAGSDVVSIHLQLSERTRELVGAREIARMKSSAIFINTSRGAIVDEQALITALAAKRIAGAGLDVFEIEPLPADHPLLRLENVTLTPHIGYSTPDVLASFYRDMPDAILAYAHGTPERVLNPEALVHSKHSDWYSALRH